MNADQRKKMEDAEKEIIIESEIEMPIEALGGQVSSERKAGLRRMTKSELQQLAQGIQSDHPLKAARTRIVKAICNCDEEQRASENKKFNGLGDPAKTDI